MRGDSDMLTCVSSPMLRACSQLGAQGGNNGAAGEVAAFIATQAGRQADKRQAGRASTHRHSSGRTHTHSNRV